ncbi:hypothetical protein [Vreelandella venusta]|uniref:hypothetical protein n=1 Tax=Vreelandella venusta TaxID=44935 RepID=UPI00200C9F9E|nr:hypothetical protein [Halomonas venusta]UQI42503.1 hypothetical protein M3L73_09655 [Halomonas venusta]
MSILNPVDHQNIVLRLLARSAACDVQHIATLAQAYKLPVSMHQIRVACDELVAQRFVGRTPYGYRLTTCGERELPALPLLESYCVAEAGGAA